MVWAERVERAEGGRCGEGERGGGGKEGQASSQEDQELLCGEMA